MTQNPKSAAVYAWISIVNDKELSNEKIVLITLYADALDELLKEGNEAAKTAFASIEQGYINMGQWVMNIHNYDGWPASSFGATLKARVVMNRIKYGHKS